MTKVILENIIYLIIALPIILTTLKKKNSELLKIFLVFSTFFIIHNLLLHLPIEYQELKIIGGNWNWTGKIFAILGSVIFLLLFRKFKLKDYYLTLSQDKTFIKKGIIVISIILLVQSIMAFIYGSPKEWDSETIFFQLTMPGIDEEIAYRGIMLGLLVKILKPFCKFTIFHPAIIVTSILFGCAHGLFFTNSYELVFRSFPFFRTLIMGLIWGWLTIKSGSILLALISHNLGNVTNKLIRMK